MPRTHEQNLNTTLGIILRGHGLRAEAEVSLKGKGGGRADGRIRFGSHTIIVEAKMGQGARPQQDALNDCLKRLDNDHCQGAIALCYPDHAAEDTLADTRLLYAIIDKDNRAPHWTTGTPADLASAVALAPAQLGNADLAAARLSDEIGKAVAALSFRQKETLAQRLDLPATPRPRRKSGQSVADYHRVLARWETAKYDTAAVRGALVIASAVMFHARLDGHLSAADRPVVDAQAPDESPYAGAWPPVRADRCLRSDNIINALADAWDTILALDYKPVFQTAIAGIRGPRPDANWRQAVSIIAKESLNLTGNLAGGRHDVMGRIFHRVLDTAPFDGSFYTGTAGATLLATLAIRPGDRDWSDLDAIRQMNVTDPACGTGTLPIAVAARIRELAGGVNPELLSAALVENVLHLYDINLTATHMAATTIGLMSPSTRFRNMNVHRTLLRPPVYDGDLETDHARLGSLEWLDRSPLLAPWPDPSIGYHADTLVEAPGLAASDLFIMNPPFARDSLRYDQFTEAEEQLIKAREDALLASTPAHRSGGTHGFTVLARRHLKDRGRIAAVYPLAMAQAKSAHPIRSRLFGAMRVEYVVALKDPAGMAFSENTAIGEMLVIASPWPPDADRENTPAAFVNILRKPQTPAQARAMGESILRGDPHPDYDVTYWPQARMQQGDWLPTQFVRAECVAAFENLNRGQWFPTANSLFAGQLGPAGRRIRDAFVKSNISAPQHALWHHKTDVQKTMASGPDTYTRPKSGKEHLAEKYWTQRQPVLLATQLRTPLTRVTAVYCASPTLGSLFVPYHPAAGPHDRTAVAKAVVAWLNSTMGIVAMLGVSSNRIIDRPNWSVDDHYQIPMPHWSRLAAAQVSRLAAAYDELCGEELRELRELPQDDIRRRLDDAVARALDIPAGELAKTRVALSSEPAITGKTYTGRPVDSRKSRNDRIRQPP